MEEKDGKGKQTAKIKGQDRHDVFGYDVAQRRNIFDNKELVVVRVGFGKQDIGLGDFCPFFFYLFPHILTRLNFLDPTSSKTTV
jgi:hypothetical protein